MLLESLESRILYSAGPIGLADSAPLAAGVPQDVRGPLVADQQFGESAEPVSISEALDLAGVQSRPWALAGADSASDFADGFAASSFDAPVRSQFYDGAPEAKIFRADFSDEDELVSGPDEDRVYHTKPDSDVRILASSPETGPETTITQSEPRISLLSLAPERLVFSSAD